MKSIHLNGGKIMRKVTRYSKKSNIYSYKYWFNKKKINLINLHLIKIKLIAII